MEQFIAQIAQQFGLNDAQAKQATSVVLGLVKQLVDTKTANDFLGALPGATDLLGSDGAGRAGGGFLGKVAGKLLGGSGGLGGAAGKIAGTLSAAEGLKAAGLDMGQIDDFIGAFAGFAKDKAGEDLTGRVIDQIRAKLL